MDPETDTAAKIEDAIDWKAHARKWEDRAKANKEELDALRPKLQQYEAAASSSQTEVEKLAAQVAELTAKAARTEREALIGRIARDHGITDSEDISLFLTGETEEALTAQAARLAKFNAATAAEATKAAEEAQRANAIVPTEGLTPATPGLSADERLAQAIHSALTGAE